MRYYYWRLALVLFSLVSSLVFSINKLEVGYNYDESKNIKGYSKEISKYDFNNDGKSEKIIVFFKLSGNKIDSYTNIFIEEGETYRLAYQIHDLSTLEISQVNKLNDKIAMMKKYYQIFSSGLGNNEVRYIDFVTSNQPENINMNLKYSKNVPKNSDNFIFLKSTAALKKQPSMTSENSSVLKYKDKPELLFEMTSSTTSKSETWFYVKSKTKDAVTEGFLPSDKGIRRGFYWTEIGNKINLINTFIVNSNREKKDLYVILAYVPLSKSYYSPVDKFGNRATQSIKGYLNSNLKGEYINLPDQTLFKKLSETKDYIELETPFYGGSYYIKNDEKFFKKMDLKEKVNKYIAIDTQSQSEVALERNKETNKYEVITYSLVTTGKDNGYSSYDTPHGVFMVAHTRTYMMFTRNLKADEKIESIPKRLKAGNDLVIAGEAPYAIRFSGGAYLHGIPGPIGASSESKWYTASKIGTYKESHKCVRHYDDQIKFLFDWLSVEKYEKFDSQIALKENAIVFVL
jgi:hypothetical protein